MISASRSYDVVILGSGIAGLAGALAAHALGLRPVVIEWRQSERHCTGSTGDNARPAEASGEA
jgi:glycine/D-amino acid oxidase-like deaminating enzyme